MQDLSIYADMGPPITVDTCPHQAHRIERLHGQERRICCTCGAMWYRASWWPVIEMDAIPDELACDLLRDECGGPYLLRVRSIVFDRADNTCHLTPAPLRFSYRKRKKDGEFEKRKSKSFVAFDRCPWCGQRYREDAKPE